VLFGADNLILAALIHYEFRCNTDGLIGFGLVIDLVLINSWLPDAENDASA
jgi:hypothetical protein